jgi:type IV fimbrial biogenesis protein FimT
MEKSNQMLLVRSSLPTVEAGFTLIELMVTLAIAAVLAMLAAPSIRDFIVRSQMTNLGNEFNASILKARNEAVNRNTCVTVCMSSSAANASPACTTSGNDWQAGWIVFLNPSCDTGLNKPSEDINMLLARPAGDATYLLQTQSNRKKITFNSRGAPGLGSAGEFDLIYESVGNAMTAKYGFNICLDSLGRTRTIPHDKTCANYQ